jgi:cell division protein FtsL
MLVAEKYKYLEEFEPQYIPKPKPPVEEQQASPTARPAHQAWQKIMSVFMIMICFGAAVLVITRYAQISKNHNVILSLEQELEREYVAQEKLKVDLACMEDLKQIEDSARAQLGMGYPGEGQVYYVSLPETEAESVQEDVVMAEEPEQSIWNRLLSYID